MLKIELSLQNTIMQNPINLRKAMSIYLTLGVLLGGAIDILWYFDIRNLPLYFCLLLFCLTFGLSYNEKNNFRLIMTSIVVAVLLSAPLFIIPNFLKGSTGFVNFPDSHGQYESYLLALPLFIYIGHSFHYAYHQDNTWRVTYPTLFAAVWDSFVMLAVASIFAQIGSFLVYFAVILFSSLGFNTLKIIISNSYFNVVLHSILFFLGLCIAQQNHKLIHNLRFLLLRMMQFLLPLLAIISIIYFILYVITFPHGAQEETIGKMILLACMVLLGIVFFNASYQTGNDGVSRWLSFLLKIYFIVLLCFDLQLIHLCFKSYELPLNVTLFLVVSFLYCLSYAISVYQSNTKALRWITASNIGIALFFLVAMWIINNPIHPINYLVGEGSQPKVSILVPIHL